MPRTIIALIAGLLSTPLIALSALAEPAVDGQLPALAISDRGEIIVDGDDVDFVPWNLEAAQGKPHIVQYFGATMSDSEVFKPFIDELEKRFPPGTLTVTTVINMDRALWGTGGFVMSELKKNKREHPDATIVVDEEGTGVELWSLGEDGRGLVILDGEGVIKFFTRTPMSEQQVNENLALIEASI